jgi:hypothetical protein
VADRFSIRSRLIAGTAVLLALRALLSLARTGPVLVADEAGYLTNARVLAGGLPGQLEMAPFYRGGYSLLIAPLINVSSDPSVVYGLVLFLNAALAASIFPLLYLLLRRFLGVPPQTAIVAALVGAIYPAVTVLSQVAMSENALFPLVCVWLIACAGLLGSEDRGRSMLWAAGVGASTGALWAVHNRMIAAVAVAVVLLAWLAVRRRIGLPALALAIALLAAAAIGTHALDRYLLDQSYGGTASSELNTRLDDLFTFSGLRTMAANLVGQTWYLLVATFGLAAAVAFDVVARARRGAARESWPSLPPVATLLGLTVALLLVSAAAFPERTRPDMLIYGRYAEIAAPPLVAIGFAVIARGRILRSVRSPLLWFALLTGAVVLIRATASDPDPANRWNVSSLPFVTMQLGPAVLIGAAVIAVLGALMLRACAERAPGLLGGLAVALLLAVGAYGVWNPVRSSERAVYPSGWTSPQAVAERESIGRVSYDLANYDTIGLYVTQWFLPESEVTLFHGAPPRSTHYVIGSEFWRQEHPHLPARRLWTDAGRDQAIWRLESSTPPRRLR